MTRAALLLMLPLLLAACGQKGPLYFPEQAPPHAAAAHAAQLSHTLSPHGQLA